MQTPTQDILRGVNLGNWLLLEKWMAPDVFAGTKARDEYTLCQELGPAAERHMLGHRDDFITDADFAWLRQRGINAVRIPFGYWLFDPDPPFVSSPMHLDRAVMLAEEHGLKVVLDLHGLPGSQGPADHSGRAGFFKWHTDRSYIERSLDVIEQIAQRYAGRPGVAAFSVINEPHESIGREILVPFFEQACDRVRKHMPAESVAFVLPAYPEGELPTYHRCLPDRENVWTDVHLYQSFGDWSQWQLLDYLAYPLQRQARLRPHLERGPIIVGEWSMSMAEPMMRELDALSTTQREMILRMHGMMQLSMLEEFTGWFFWSYRVANNPAWSFRDAVERGWLPDHFGGVQPVAPRQPALV